MVIDKLILSFEIHKLVFSLLTSLLNKEIMSDGLIVVSEICCNDLIRTKRVNFILKYILRVLNDNYKETLL